LLGDRVQRLGVTVVTYYEPLPAVAAHPGHLNQVWMNVLTNALDALEGRPDPQLRITVARHGGDGRQTATGAWIDVTIGDNGAGIAAQHLPKIFEPFFTTKPIGRGTGLGLSIAYGAVKAANGTITVDSQAGRGTTVTVRLPVT
jgi:two-component system NtrC family sensor kinase